MRVKASFWDKKSPIGNMLVEQIYRRIPDCGSKDIIVMDYESGQKQIVTVDEVKAEHAKETVGMTSNQVKEWFVKYRTSVLSEADAAVRFRETGYMESMADLQEQILILQYRIDQLENK